MREPDVLADIRAVRDELASRHGGDAGSLSRALIERSRIAGRAVVQFPARLPASPRALNIPSTSGLPVPPKPISVVESTTRADGEA